MIMKQSVMLLGKYGSRNEIYDLLAFLDSFERGADRNFRFAVSHVSAYQAIHYFVGFHVVLCILDSPALVFGLFKREQFLKLSLPYRVRTVYVSFFGRSCGIQIYKILRNDIYRFLNLGLGLRPLLTSELVKLRSM